MTPTQPQFSTTLEKVLWEQLQTANRRIETLQEQLGMVIDRQLYRPVTHPRTDLETAEPDDAAPLAETEIDDEEEVKNRLPEGNKTLEQELEAEFDAIEREQEESHAAKPA